MTAPHFTDVFAPAYGQSWEAVTNMLLSDPGELEIVETLRAMLRDAGEFHLPVVVELWDTDDFDEDDELDDVLSDALRAAGLEEHAPPVSETEPAWTVANGTHRTVAALLEDLPIRFRVAAHDEDVHASGTPQDLIEVDFELVLPEHLEPASSDEGIDERFDYMFSWLRSFPVGDVWVEADVMSASNDVMHAMYACPVARAYDLTDTMIARAARHGVRLTVLNAQQYVYDPDEDDPDL